MCDEKIVKGSKSYKIKNEDLNNTIGKGAFQSPALLFVKNWSF